MSETDIGGWARTFGAKLLIGGLLMASIGLVGFKGTTTVSLRDYALWTGFLIAGLGQYFSTIERRLSRLEREESRPDQGSA